MYNASFYPTPREVASRMLQGFDALNLAGRTVLEPSAGSPHLPRPEPLAGALLSQKLVRTMSDAILIFYAHSAHFNLTPVRIMRILNA